jgi:hypothetical protein
MIMKRLSTHFNASTTSNDDPTQLKQAEESWQYLEDMPLDLLEQKMDELGESLQQAIDFVRDQEEEVLEKLEEIDNLREKLNRATGEEHTAVLEELLEEENRCHLLAKTLIGQRRTLDTLKVTLNKYQQIFLKRKRDAIFNLDQQGLNFYSVGKDVSNVSWARQKNKFMLSYPVLYTASAALILLLTLPSAIFRVPPLSILQALGDQQGREAVLSGDSRKLQNYLREIKLQEKGDRDLEN